MREFDRPEVTLCGWQDAKIHLITNQEETKKTASDVTQPIDI